MYKQLVNLFLIILMLGISTPVLAQRDATNVKVENLSDQQIQQIADEINNRGLTIEQATQLAKARGASQLQIDQLTRRLQQMKLSPKTNASTKTTGSKTDYTPAVMQPMADTGYYAGVDTLNQKKLTEVSEKTKKLFGYQLFNRENLTFEPSVNIPVPADYVLGINDEVIIQVWGASQQTYMLQVDNAGAINIPDLGPVKVAGLNYTASRDLIAKRLTAIYSGMSGSNPNTFADVSINNLRSIKVNVIGEAINPGTYTLPATASAFNALYLSGGPNENGSFRNIRIMRDNKLFAEIDVYDYLINANTKNNISLRDQDILFIPAYHKRVETIGTFKRNGIFELKDDESINQLLQFTGGFSEEASQSRLLVTRFSDNQYRLVDIDKSKFSDFQLKNGDLIQSEKVIDRFENRITIEGAVFRPGTYALDENMKLSQLIQKAGGLREDYFAQRGLIIRLDEQLYPTTIPFNLAEINNGTYDPLLKREDQIIIRDIFSMGEKQTVRIFGEVMEPGEYDFYRSMALKDLIFLSGGMTEAASESYIEVARRNSHEEASVINSKMASLFQFKIDRNLNLTDEDAGFVLQPFDQVYIRKAPSYQTQQSVRIDGEVQFPGEYSISDKNERISDLLRRAGGLTPNAFAEGAKLKRYQNDQMQNQMDALKNLQDKLDTTIELNLSEQYANLELRMDQIIHHPGSTYDYFLKDKDQITIPMETKEIWVNGEVLNPIGLAWESGRSMKYYINRSGGFSPNAKKSKLYVVYSNGTTNVTKSFIFKKYPNVDPGSRIIVPAKPEHTGGDTGKWLAITSALSSLAVAIAAVLR